VLEAFGGFAAPGAGGQAVIVPGRVGAEVALPRPHLVKATRVELGKAHKWMGRQRGAVGVAFGTRRFLLPFLHQEFLAEVLKLRVGAARGRVGVLFSQQVLGGDRKGRAAVSAKEEKQRVGESVQREVSPVLGRGSQLSPGEGQAGTRVAAAKDSVIGDVTVYRRCL